MCGIIGATGSDEVLDVLLEGLARLEYRGYDSAGVALQRDGALWRARAATGTRSLEDLRKVVPEDPLTVAAGIGHTRWATHGHPTEANAHPLLDCSGTVAVVHNGIIENWRELATRLQGDGHTLASETDTEVLAHLIEEEMDGGSSMAEAVRATLRVVRGAFALAVVCANEPGTIVAGRRVSPLVIGMGEQGQALLASDIPALLGRTRRFWVLDDDQIVELRPGSMRVTTLAGKEVEPNELHVDWDIEAAEKGGFPDFMGKEIHEQPRAVADTLLGRLLPDGTLALDELRIGDDELRQVDKVFVVACGTSYHAGMVAKYAIEHWTRLPTEIDIASEFRYRDPVLDGRTLVVGVSQSGETIDTLQAMREARRGEAKVMVISNVVDSSMARDADGVMYTRAGPEVGVAATKTHLAQVTALELLALYLAQLRGTVAPADVGLLVERLAELPDLIDRILQHERTAQEAGTPSPVAQVAGRLADTRDFFFLGRHVGFPVALEGALKLKEISYLRAEGYPAGELKHGPIALIVPGTVVVGVATRTELWEKMMGNVAEVRARGATVVLVANEGDHETAQQADEVLWVPETHKLFAPILDVVPLQLLAYHIARMRGHDVDRPRNLAKTVTVE
ncbi:MAG TPA: glutamine--fructose-6-phosphate transaminase (isomerizing) [Acidimicrobiales bacterium]|nr:glutamine--fructose-6-phosphate transaminase (isomerizing) [Acidimicrobiales bacterium]